MKTKKNIWVEVMKLLKPVSGFWAKCLLAAGLSLFYWQYAYAQEIFLLYFAAR